MEITRDTLKKYGKLAGIGVVGAGVGGAAMSQADTGPTQDEYQNLQDKVSDLNQTNSDLQDELDARPTQEVVDNLKQTIQDKNDKIDTLFTQEEVEDAVADATEREGLVDFLPVVVDDEVELTGTHVDADADATDSNQLNGGIQDGTVNFDSSELDDEFDEVHVTYTHDDGHEYKANVKTFEDSETADEYESEVEEHVDDQEYGDNIRKDAEVIRDGDTVVYLYGEAADSDSDYDSYDFDAVANQY